MRGPPPPTARPATRSRVGDFDSIAPGELDRLRAAGIAIEVAPSAKDESDTELAVLAALAEAPTP